MAIMRSVSLYEELYLEYFFYFSRKILFSDKIISTFIKLYFSNNLFVFLYLNVKLIPDTVYAFYIIRYVWCNFQFFLKLLMWLFIAFREYSLIFFFPDNICYHFICEYTARIQDKQCQNVKLFCR